MYSESALISASRQKLNYILNTNAEANNVYKILDNITNSYYKVIISAANGSLVIVAEILGKKIITVNSIGTQNNFKLEIISSSLYVSGISGNINVSLDFISSDFNIGSGAPVSNINLTSQYDYGKYYINGSVLVQDNIIENRITFTNATVESLTYNTTAQNLSLGNWSFNYSAEESNSFLNVKYKPTQGE